MEEIDRTNIVTGSHAREKKERAAQFRQQMTPAEARLWQYLRAGRLDGLHFRRQQIIDGFIVDFYCHKAALVVELDGPIHEEQKDYDAARGALFELRGLLVLRFPNECTRTDISLLLRQIATVARNRIAALHTPPAKDE